MAGEETPAGQGAGVTPQRTPDGSPAPDLARVRLQEGATAASLLGACSAPEGRYQDLGEIARGGMGVVVRSRDASLGRDVALKLLLDEYVGREAVVTRFVEEAQIGSQLQHPGIVPVYDVGLRDGKRPYFTMKLVKGRTLAALLAERTSPADDLRRFLSIFEGVCNTMAYAHARGVIHRDLKPSNVMTGQFGEVLVVDWGLGKVLGEGGVVDERLARRRQQEAADQTVVHTLRSGTSGTHSQLGSVLGTPFYMPPEQARGEAETLDERADVFALGAILCEILTGSPPYTGQGAEPLLKARQADLIEAKERLRASGVDPYLVSLCLRCMAPAPTARPRNAAAVVRDLASFNARIEERVRDADVEATRSHARTAAHARERRLTVVLAATIALAVATGGAAIAWTASGDADRAAAVTRAVDTALDRVSRARGAATTAGTSESWAGVVEVARRADALARQEGVEPSERDRARKAMTEAVEEERQARSREAAQESEAKSRARLAELVDLRGVVRPDRYTAQAEALFADLGIDLTKLSTEAAAAKVRASPLADLMIAALESSSAGTESNARAVAPYADVAKAADSDPWRAKVREAKTWEEVRVLAEGVDLRKLPVASIVLFGNAASAMSGGTSQRADVRRERASLYRSAWLDHPGSPEIHDGIVSSARALESPAAFGDVFVRPAHDAVRRHAFSNLALHPDSAYARAGYGRALLVSGDAPGAEAVAREAIRRDAVGDAAPARILLLDVLAWTQRPEEGLTAAREWVARAPESSTAHVWLAFALHDLEKADDAIDEARKATTLDQSDPGAWRVLGNALVQKNRLEEAVAPLRKVLELRPDWENERYMLVSVLDSLGRGEEARALADEGRARNPESLLMRWTVDYLYEETQTTAATIDRYRETLRREPEATAVRTQLACTLAHSGDPVGMLECYRAAEEYDDSGYVNHEAARHVVRFRAYAAALGEAEEDMRRTNGERAARYVLLYVLELAGDGPRLLEEATRAVKLDPRNSDALLQLARGRYEAEFDLAGADQALRAAASYRPNVPKLLDATIRIASGDVDGALTQLDPEASVFGWTDDERETDARTNGALHASALFRSRQYARARDRFRSHSRAMENYAEGTPERRESVEAQLRRYDRAAGLAAELPAMRAGEFAPEDPEDLAVAGWMLSKGGAPARGIESFLAAFEKSPDLVASWRVPAAEAAVLAAREEAGLGEAARSALRARAYGWLRAEVAAAGRAVSDADDAASARRRSLEALPWPSRNFDLADVGFPSRIARLPEEEAARWRELWRQVRILRTLCEPASFE